MALHADFKNRGGLQGLQGLFNPKAGKKVFAASLDSVLPDARSQKLASTGGKLPVLQAARAQDPLKSESPGPPVAPGPTPEPEPVEPRKWSRVFQNAVQSLVKQVHQVSDDSKPQEKTLEPEIEDKHEAPAMTSTLSEPKPPEQQKSPDARMRRVLARARLPAKQPERIEEIKNIEVFAERLVDAYGSLTLAFQAFDSHGRSEVTRSQFDAALDALGLDIPELCDIPASKLFSLVSRASKKPIGALTEQAWTAFFKKYLEKTASAHLLDADVNIQAALSQLAELHRLQPRRDYGRQDNQAAAIRGLSPFKLSVSSVMRNKEINYTPYADPPPGQGYRHGAPELEAGGLMCAQGMSWFDLHGCVSGHEIRLIGTVMTMSIWQGSEAPPRRWGVVAAAAPWSDWFRQLPTYFQGVHQRPTPKVAQVSEFRNTVSDLRTACKVLDDEAMAKLAIFEDVGEPQLPWEQGGGMHLCFQVPLLHSLLRRARRAPRQPWLGRVSIAARAKKRFVSCQGRQQPAAGCAHRGPALLRLGPI